MSQSLRMSGLFRCIKLTLEKTSRSMSQSLRMSGLFRLTLPGPSITEKADGVAIPSYVRSVSMGSDERVMEPQELTVAIPSYVRSVSIQPNPSDAFFPTATVAIPSYVRSVSIHDKTCHIHGACDDVAIPSYVRSVSISEIRQQKLTIRSHSRNPFVCQVCFDQTESRKMAGKTGRNPFVCQVCFDPL